jgi:hypothetical protein
MSDRLPGSSWSNPVWHKGFRIYVSDFMFPGMAYEYCHDDYDGADDANDNRCGHAASIDAAKFEIDAEFFCADCDRPVSSCVCEPKEGTDDAL